MRRTPCTRVVAFITQLAVANVCVGGGGQDQKIWPKRPQMRTQLPSPTFRLRGPSTCSISWSTKLLHLAQRSVFAKQAVTENQVRGCVGQCTRGG